LAGTPPGVCTVPGLSATGFISIGNLMADASDQLAAAGGNLTLAGNPKRVCQTFTENALNVTNNNQNFAGCPTPVVRPTTCPTATPTPVCLGNHSAATCL